MPDNTSPTAPPAPYVGRHRLPDHLRVEQYITGCWHVAGEQAWTQCHPTRIEAMLSIPISKAVAA